MKVSAKRRRGPPARHEWLRVRLTDRELEAIDKAAEKRNMTLSAWVREVLARATIASVVFGLLSSSCSSPTPAPATDAGAAPVACWQNYGHACDAADAAELWGACCLPLVCTPKGRLEPDAGAGELARCN